MSDKTIQMPSPPPTEGTFHAAPVEIVPIRPIAPPPKPGFLTTEFWMSNASILGFVLGLIPADWRGAAVAVVTAAYSISRAVIKKKS